MKVFSEKNLGIISNIELKQTKYKILYWSIFTILVFISIISFLPSIWVLLSGFKDVKEIYRIPSSFFPKEIRLSKLVEVWKLLNFTQSYIATFMITIGDLIFCLTFPALGGYVLSKLKPRGTKLIMTLLLWTMMMPGQIRTVPLFMIFNRFPIFHFSLLDTYWPLWMMAGANIFDTLLFKSFFDSIPFSYIEAARIDGCSDVKTFAKIILPLSKPVIIVVSIFSVNNSWSSFLWPLLILKTERLIPITVKIFRMTNEYQLDHYMLALIFSIIPPVIIYLIFQNQILGGISLGGIKG